MNLRIEALIYLSIHFCLETKPNQKIHTDTYGYCLH